jgi:hypothetical protein
LCEDDTEDHCADERARCRHDCDTLRRAGTGRRSIRLRDIVTSGMGI